MTKNRTKKKPLLLIILLLFTAVMVKSQTVVEGKVSDSEGLEIIGATVVVKGKPAEGVITDLDGKYKINVANPSQDVLVFSYLGMKTQELKVNGRKAIDIALKADEFVLDEVVAVGYGTMKRSDISGSVSSVKGKEINKIPVTSVAQALSGKIAGVQVTQTQGSPDAAIDIRVRGGMSITQNNDPLYIIDGFQSESGLKGLDPSDIETIDVLKDASATAIYGAAGANGVILITTKKAKEGKPVISYDMYIGFKKLTKRMDLLSNEEFVRLEYERGMIGGADEKQNFINRYGDGVDKNMDIVENMYLAFDQIHETWGNRKGINWQDEVFKNNSPMSVNHKVGIAGGTKTASYNVSYSYSDEDGIMSKSGLSRNNIRGKFAFQVTPKLKITANVNYTDETTTGMGSLNESGYFSRMQHIIQYRPVYVKNKDDKELLNLNKDEIMEDENGNQMQNPLISIDSEKRENKNKILSLNGDLSYSILKNLTYKATMGYRTRNMVNDLFYAEGSRQQINAGLPWGKRNINDYQTIQFNQTLSWNTKINKLHKIDALIGQEYVDRDDKYTSHTYTGFENPDFELEDLSLATQMGIPTSGRSPRRQFSLFTRVNYNFNEKYLATFTLRADQSSVFPKDERWGYFPAISFAWRAIEEPFIKNLNTFSDLKLRLSYGTSGNNNINPYLSKNIMGSFSVPFDNSLSTGYGSIQLANPFLRWETNKTANFGLDFGFFDQRIQASLDIYQNKASDLLLNSGIPKHMVESGKVMKNVGETENRGIEFSLSTVNVNTSDFSWTTSLNLSHNKNKVKALDTMPYFTSVSGWATSSEYNDNDYITRVGSTVGLMYGYKLKGLYGVDEFESTLDAKGKYVLKPGVTHNPSSMPQPGSWKFEDLDQSEGQAGIINSNDKTVIGDATPDLYGGFINNFTYKAFDLSFGFTFKVGGDVYNANKMYYTKMSNRGRNSLKESAGRFTYIDENGRNVFADPAALDALNQNAKMASIPGSSNLVFHSGYVEDGSYLRLDNLTFGYTLPKKLTTKFFVNNLRVYMSTYNLFTISGYSGFDPEVNVRPNGGLTPNVDWGAYPRSLSFVFGLNLTL